MYNPLNASTDYLLMQRRFRGGLVFKAHRLLYHSTLGLRVIKKTKKKTEATDERGGNNLNGLKFVRTENGSSKSQNLALTGLFVPSSLDRGRASQKCESVPKRARI